MRTAGRPASPTTHPRTKPEANDYAVKNRQTNDWFRHDGKNVEPPPPGVTRLPTETAQDVADRNKAERSPGDWFQHDDGPMMNGHDDVGKARVDRVKGPKCRGEEAVKIQEKMKGNGSQWYKYDDNQDYVEPKPKLRLATPGAEEVRDRITGQQGAEKEWFQHEHKDPTSYTPPRQKSRQCNKQGSAIKQRMESRSDWYSHDKKTNEHTNGTTPSSSGGAVRPSRLLSPDAEENMDRNKKGSASEWFSHEQNGIQSPQYCLSPRGRTPEGDQIAKKFTSQSNDWFKHEDNKHYTDPVPKSRCPSADAKHFRSQNNGSQMSHVLSRTNGHTNGHDQTDARIKPEAAEFARKNVQGMMSRYMNTDANREYNSPRAPRIKPEAAANAAKNRGVMDESMGGYLDTPRQHGARRVKPEAQENQTRSNGSAMGSLMGNYGNLTPSSRKPVKTVSGDGVNNANKNNNCEMSRLIGQYGQLEVSGRPVPRLQTADAQANARRWQGEAASVIYGGD